MKRFVWVGPVFVNVDHIVQITDAGQTQINRSPEGGSWVTLSDGNILASDESPAVLASRIMS